MYSIDKTQCIIWEGPVWSQGRYGCDFLNGKYMGAHRAAWIRKHGPIPEGLVVCHKCDNGLCVNTDHLFLGTMKDNMHDCTLKGRNRGRFKNQSGQNNNRAKPNLEKRYRQIKEDRIRGMSLREIRIKHGLKSNGHLINILRSRFG